MEFLRSESDFWSQKAAQSTQRAENISNDLGSVTVCQIERDIIHTTLPMTPAVTDKGSIRLPLSSGSLLNRIENFY
jgi:hypothetical protein